MIVKNEEEVLARCLDSVASVVDEIVIVDTGSTDRTIEIAREYGASIHHFEWIDDFAAARNVSFQKATSPYIMWLDADDVLLPEALEGIRELKNRLDKDVYYLGYDYSQDASGRSLCMLQRERIIRNGAGIIWKYPIHECLVVEHAHTTEQVGINITHMRTHAGATADESRNLRILERAVRTDDYRNDARICYYLAREYHDAGREQEAIETFRRFLELPDGWIEDRICSRHRIAKCYLALALREPELAAEHRARARAEAKLARAMDDRWAEPHFTLGMVAFQEGDMQEAVFWFEKCLRPAPPVLSPLETWCYTAGPAVQLCLAYDRLGNTELASHYNEKALEYLPHDTGLQANREYFRRKLIPSLRPTGSVKLNLGAGNKRYLDYRSCDKFPGDDVDEVFPLDRIPYADETIEAIHSEHALEHTYHQTARAALAEWFRVLKPGGTVILKLPDLAECCRQFLAAETQEHRDWYRYTIYGIQRSLWGEPMEGQIHHTGFTEQELVEQMRAVGFAIDYHGTYDGYGTPSIEVHAHKPMPDLTVDIIIPTYTNPEYLHECVRSITACTPHPHRVIVVNSGPQENTVGLPEGITVVQSNDRLCFSEAINIGIGIGRSPYVCFMNDDVIVSHGWLEPLVQAVRGRTPIEGASGRVGIANPLSNCDIGWLHDYDMNVAGMPLLPGTNTLVNGTVGLKGNDQPGIAPELLYSAQFGHTRAYRRDWVAFFCTVVAREVLNDVGRMDEEFINGSEDLDFCLRAGRAGWESCVVESSFVFHFGGTSRAARQREMPEMYQQEDDANVRRIAMKYDRPILVIHTGHSYEEWTSRNIASGGIGGSETAAARMAEEFALLGYRAIVFSSCPGDQGEYNGVEYLDYARYPAFAATHAVDVLIASRYVSILQQPVVARRRYLWAHDIFALGTEQGQHDLVRAWYNRLDGIFCLSPWHVEYFANHHGIPREKIILTGNGIDVERFAIDVPKQPLRFIYASSPDRGLDTLLVAFPMIRRLYPEAELHVFYGFDNWNKAIEASGDEGWRGSRDRILAMLRQPGVYEHGRVDQARLAEEYLRSDIWFYPTHFTETYCISALEAQMAGALCVCSRLGGLISTVGNRGVLIDGDPISREYLMRSIGALMEVLNDPERKADLVARGRAWAREQTWHNRAAEWHALFTS